MFRNFIKISLRNLWKDKTFTALNSFGLAVAFGVAILLGIYALFDLSTDKFHMNKDAIYEVYTLTQTAKGTEVSNSNPVPFADALKEEVPGVEKISRYLSGDALFSHKDKTIQLDISFVDPDFLSMFSFPAVEASSVNPIESKSSIAITQKTAKRIFGNENALGQILNGHVGGQEFPLTVTAVLEDIPAQSSINFDAVINFKALPDGIYASNLNSWNNSNHQVFLELAKGIAPKQFESSTSSFYNLHYKMEIERNVKEGAQADALGHYMQLRLLPFVDSSFVTYADGAAKVNKSLQYLILGMAFLIVFIAGVNFINMSIAKGSQRIKEIGVRKTLGADKKQLFFQFWGESLVVFTISLVIGGGLAFLLLDKFQTLFQTQADFYLLANPMIAFGFLLCVLLISFLAGGYSALLMSKVETLKGLKGKLENNGKHTLRNVLIVIQFSIAILLISGTMVLWNQLDYMRTKDLGFNKEQVIALPLNTKKDKGDVIQLLRNTLEGEAGILSISAADNNLGLGKDGISSKHLLGFVHKGRTVKTNMLNVDYDYIETLGLSLLEGRDFRRDLATDGLSVVINETMARELGEENPLEVQFMLDGNLKISVIGVVKDYHFEGLNKTVEPISLFMIPEEETMEYAYVKVAPSTLVQSFDKVEAAWKSIEPDASFLGSFLDENIERTFKKEKRIVTIISSSSILAIILSCIGLFAISLLVVNQRRKEIGIRKVVGASTYTIAVLLSKDFLKLVGIAFFIATPIAWYLSSKWLQTYAYRIDLNMLTFLSAGILAMLIALATISIRTLQAATANPVESLKSE